MQMKSIGAQLLAQRVQAGSLQHDLEAAHAQHAQVCFIPCCDAVFCHQQVATLAQFIQLKQPVVNLRCRMQHFQAPFSQSCCHLIVFSDAQTATC